MPAAKFSLRPGGDGVEVDRATLDVIFAKMSRFGWDNISLTLQSNYFLREVDVFDAPTLRGAWQLFRLRRLARKADETWSNLFSAFGDPADEERVRGGYTDDELGALVVAASNRIS